jgi:hypothetical protein
VSFILMLVLVSLACGSAQPTPTQVSTATVTVMPSQTPRPSPTPRPTKTPNLAATQRADELNAVAQDYFEKGYLTTPNGKFTELDDFVEEWAQLGWYQWWVLDHNASDFYMSAHFRWQSAYRNSDISGCGFVFALRENNDHYAVFLDRARILFLNSDESSGSVRPVGTTRGPGGVKFGEKTEADFTLIVKGAYAYVLVDGEVAGEYTLTQSRPLLGNVGLTILSGTNKDYGTRCEMTDLHLWIPEK